MSKFIWGEDENEYWANEYHARTISEARQYFKDQWPEQLDSGIMFYNGERITKKEFETGSHLLERSDA